MKATGNGRPQTCVQNLLKTIRGEVPYERLKGIDRTLIDRRLIREVKLEYVTDAKNYVSSGVLHCYSRAGRRKWSVRTGDIPAHTVFIQN